MCVYACVSVFVSVWYGQYSGQKEHTRNGLYFYHGLCWWKFYHTHANPRNDSLNCFGTNKSCFGMNMTAHVDNDLRVSIWTGRWTPTKVRWSLFMPCTPSLPESIAPFDRLVSERLNKFSMVTYLVCGQGGIWTQADVGLYDTFF